MKIKFYITIIWLWILAANCIVADIGWASNMDKNNSMTLAEMHRKSVAENNKLLKRIRQRQIYVADGELVFAEFDEKSKAIERNIVMRAALKAFNKLKRIGMVKDGADILVEKSDESLLVYFTNSLTAKQRKDGELGRITFLIELDSLGKVIKRGEVRVD